MLSIRALSLLPHVIEALADIVPGEFVAFGERTDTSPFDLLVERERNGGPSGTGLATGWGCRVEEVSRSRGNASSPA
jgi:hypothetical protein